MNHDWPGTAAEVVFFILIALFGGLRLADRRGFGAVWQAARGCIWRLPYNAFSLGFTIFAGVAFFSRLPRALTANAEAVEISNNIPSGAHADLTEASMAWPPFSIVQFGIILILFATVLFSMDQEMPVLELLERNVTGLQDPPRSTIGKAERGDAGPIEHNIPGQEPPNVYNARMFSLWVFFMATAIAFCYCLF